MNDPDVVQMMSGRDFTTPEDPLPVDLEEDVVLDVIILARVVRKEDIGTGRSAVIILSENQSDDLMVTGILNRAQQIDMSANFVEEDD